MATLQVALQKTSSIRMYDPSRLRALVGAGGKQILQQVRPPEIVNEIRATGENFTHLKLTAEKMLQEQACAKSDLEILNAKLHKAEEQVRVLETKLQDVSNENAMLRVKHKEDTKLWDGLESRFMSTQAFFDQITETLHSLEAQVQQGESNRRYFEDESRKEKELVLARIAAAETATLDTQRHSELQLEAKQAEMCKQLGELSQRHDQILNDMKRQFECETEEAVFKERSKAEDEIREIRKQFEQLMVETRNSAAQELERSSAEHAATIKELQESFENVKAEMSREKDSISNSLDTLREEHSAITRELQATSERYEELLLKEQQQASCKVAAAENLASETRRQLETELESRQTEMSKHLQQLAQRNEEAMNVIKRRHEDEMNEVVSKERAKAENEAEAVKRKYEQLLVEARKSAVDELQRLKAEHDSTIKQLGESYENNLKTTMLRERESMARTLDTLRDEVTNNMKRQCEIEVEAAVLRERESGKTKYEKLLLEARDSAARELEKLKAEHAAAMDKMKAAHEAKLKARNEEVTKANTNEEATMTKTFTKRKARAPTTAQATAKRKKKAASTSSSDGLFGNACELDPYAF